ncbi:hypothetical protein FI667_g2339, partial [Globisporangium splendens]
MNSSSDASRAFRPPWLPLQSTVSSASSSSSSLAHAVAAVRPTKAPPVAEKPPAAGAVPLVRISNAGDGLPSHARRCSVAPPSPATFDGDAPWPHHGDAMTFVDVYGDVSSRDAVRQQLLRFYEDTKQIAPATGMEKGDAALTTTAMVGDGISEMTLRIDTELELLRRQCFAERNAQWNYYTPDMFTYEPVAEPQWLPQQSVSNRKLAWTRQNKQDASENGDEKDSVGVIGMMDGHNKRGVSVGEFARDRPWPPKEFTQKANTRPPRARGGKRKAPAAVMEEKSVFSRLCAECQTQTTPLWRKVPREVVTSATATANGQKKAGKQTTAVPVTPAVVAQPTDPLVPSDDTSTPQEQPEPEQVDVCLTCYLKLQRRDVFERKKAEKAKQAREKKERVAAQALAEKKRLKQQIQLLKKQQAQVQALAKSSSKQHVKRQDDAEVPVPPIKIVIKSEAFVDQGEVANFGNSNGGDAAQDNGDEHDSKDNVQWLAEASAAKRKDKKKSKKDKKKKKKKSSSSKKSKTRDVEDEDAGERGDEDDNASESDSGMPAMPSPPQREGSYEHADRASRAAAAPSVASDQEEEAIRQRRRRHEVKQEVDTAADTPSVTSSSRIRKGRSESVVSVTTSTGDAPPAPPSSRKRKSSIVAAAAAASVVALTTKDASSARASRSKATPAVVSLTAATPPPVVVLAPPRKRVRAKETARERELRALGQYCPVCNLTYEEDDESSFVCCDSCEMWVHAACDTALTPESIAVLADSSEKYICPLCAGR